MRSGSSPAVIGASLLVLIAALWARPAAATCNKCASFVVNIQIVNGVIRTADPKNAQLLHKEFFPPNRPIPDDLALKKILAADLDAVLKDMSPLYWYGLNATNQKNNGFRKSIPPCLLGSYKNTEWDEFKKCYMGFHRTLNPVPNGLDPVREVLSKLQGALIGGGALQNLDSHPSSDGNEGQLTFLIVAPDIKWSASLPSADVPLRHDLVSYLDTFDRGIWRQEHIKQLIDDFYSRRGLTAHVEVRQSKLYPGKLPWIMIDRNPKVTLVTLVPPANGPDDGAAELDRWIALYNLFSTKQFEGLREIQPTKVTENTPIQYDSLNIPPGLQPVFNSIPFAAAQADLAARGLTVAQGSPSDATDPAVIIKVIKNDPNSKAGKTTATAPVQPGAPAVPSERNTHPVSPFPAHAKFSNGAAVQPEGSDTDQPDQPAKAPPKDKKGYIGLGFSYLPGQGVRPIGAFEYQRLFGVANIKLDAGSANNLANGTGSASFDYLFFHTLLHRFSVDFNGGSDSTYHRLIGVRQLNERRNGGTGNAQIELLRDPLGSSLRFHADGGAQTVTLTDPKSTGAAATAVSDTLVSADVGATYVLSLLQVARPLQLQIDPGVRAGTAAKGAFAKGSVTAFYHQEALLTSVFEVKAQFTAATNLTPVFELPSFGGVSSVRGFRADDLLALRVWTVQPELWHGVPLPEGTEGRLADFLNNSVRLAAFCDFGGANQTYAGPGAGLRVQYHQATFRLDWAYGLGTVAGGSGHGRVYFSVSTPIR